jgi:hypothetical protein
VTPQFPLLQIILQRRAALLFGLFQQLSKGTGGRRSPAAACFPKVLLKGSTHRCVRPIRTIMPTMLAGFPISSEIHHY